MKTLPLIWITTGYLLLGYVVHTHCLNGNLWTFPLVVAIVTPFFWNTYLVFFKREKEPDESR